MELNDKVAVITGGGTGIGRATALLLARRGVNVAVNYSRSQEDAESAVAEIRALGRNAVAVRADISDAEQAEDLMRQAVKSLGRLDILVNNAGWTAFVDFKDMDSLTDEIWDHTYGVNVKGPFYCIRAAARHMTKPGAIVNVSSLAAALAKGSSIAYCASKAALNVVTRATARVLAPDIRVNAVAPGVVRTRWVADQKAFVRGAELQTPMRRVAEPDDVAQVIVALIADSDFVTGQIVTVDGGIGV
jgi:3-oxoacyl-[acyl-carrier protein] reductase